MPARHSTDMSQEDLKAQVEHLESISLPYAQNGIEADYVQVAADGYVATDEKGRPLVHVDPQLSKKLCRKVSCVYRAGVTYADLLHEFDLSVVPMVAVSYLFCFIDRAE